MKQTGTAFCKPFGAELLGTARTVQYIYPREELVTEPIFPYFVLDGGAFLFAKDTFGTADGDDLLALTMSGKLFDAFQTDGTFHWEASFAFTRNEPGFLPKYEWQIWPQRLYMTLPLAHAFLKTGERRYADRWLEIVKKWDKDHPYQPFLPGVNYLETDMVWRDMQVAWRALSLMHGVFMLQDAPFSREDWAYLYRFLTLHFDHLLQEAEDRIARGLKQNHVLQIGVAMVMAGALFPELPRARDYLRAGTDTVRMNMHAVYADGGSDEDSPSYNHFIARLYLETYLLLSRNGLPVIDGLLPFTVKQYEFLYQCETPGGQAPRFSDSYAIDAEADFRRVARLIPLDFAREKRSVLFPDSAMAVLRRGTTTLIADAMNCRAGHRHYGRPQPLLFRGCEPILVDSGCCSYDLWDFYFYLHTPAAHNVVFCPDFPDDYVGEKSDVLPSVTRFDASASVLETESAVSYGGKPYVWRRKITLDENRAVIEDRATSDAPLRFRSHLHFARRHTLVKDAHTLCQLLPHEMVTVTSELPAEVLFSPVMNDRNEKDYARTMRCDVTGREYRNTTVIAFTERK